MPETNLNAQISLLNEYQIQLDTLRQEWVGLFQLPDAPFLLFGMGKRRKLIYQTGVLRDALSGTVLQQWDVTKETIVPPAYAVWFETSTGNQVVIVEDEDAIWLVEDGNRMELSEVSPLSLPTFEGHRYGLILRVLHQEILINIRDGLPVPNFMVYPRPWYRDGAMMAMVLRETDNLDLIRNWVLSLNDPYDHNNGNDEPDNLGQALYLLSLFADANHLLVKPILVEIERFRQGDYILGVTDGGPHPVYQTQWLKLGLGALKLPDPFQVPKMADEYAALCWWGERCDPVHIARTLSADYPYLTWAADIFFAEKNGIVGNRDYPLSWEANASQANYAGTAIISPVYTRRKLAAPHTWHAAEMFFRLLSVR